MVKIRKTTILILISIFLAVVFANAASAKLMVQDFELKSEGNDDEVKPAEVLTIQYSVVNEGDNDMRDVEVTMWIERNGKKLEGNDGDSIEPVFDLNDIDAGSDKSVDYDLVIPWDVEDGNRYTIYTKIKGKNASNDVRLTYEETLGEFKIVKDSRELFVNASFDRTVVKCGDSNSLMISVRNIGANDEDSVNITAVNAIIGVDVHETTDMDKSYTDSTNVFEKTYPFTVNPNTNAGKYELSVRAKYDGGYKEIYKTINMTVESCTPVPQNNNNNQNNNPPAQNNTQQVNQSTQNPQTNAQPDQNNAAIPATNAAKSSGLDRTTLILIIVGAEVGILLIALIIYIIVRKPKRPQQMQYQYQQQPQYSNRYY